MAIITLTRISSTNFSNSNIIAVLGSGINQLKQSPDAVWLLFTDLIVNVRTLYDSIDYVNSEGYLYGETYLQYTLGFIPGGGTFITMIFLQKLPKWTNTDNILIDFTNAPYGMGTNMVADTYMNLSIIGLIIFPLVLGLLVKYTASCDSKYKTFLYIALIANAVYIPRASMLCFLDMFFFLIICDYLLNFFFYRKRLIFKFGNHYL